VAEGIANDTDIPVSAGGRIEKAQRLAFAGPTNSQHSR